MNTNMNFEYDFHNCALCPRNCHADRVNGHGFCRSGSQMTAARAGLHFWEEPCISGKRGSGTVFFTGCHLGCSFCQNYDISKSINKGLYIDKIRLREICFELKEKGAHNINLVTPTHYAPLIAEAVYPIKSALAIPVICNTGGYDMGKGLEYLAEVCDVFLPDFKFASAENGKTFANAENYPEIALDSIKFMVKSAGKPRFDEDGMIIGGTIVRHLVLPGQRADSIKVMDILGENFKSDEILVSLMSQYTPNENASGKMARRVSSFEYDSVAERCLYYGFDGYMQGKSSAKKEFTPKFDLSGVKKE